MDKKNIILMIAQYLKDRESGSSDKKIESTIELILSLENELESYLPGYVEETLNNKRYENEATKNYDS